MTLLSGDVEFLAKVSAGGGREELTVVGLDGVEAVVMGDEAEEGAVGFEVAQARIRGGVSVEKLAEVRDGFPGTGFGVDASDDVR